MHCAIGLPVNARRPSQRARSSYKSVISPPTAAIGLIQRRILHPSEGKDVFFGGGMMRGAQAHGGSSPFAPARSPARPAAGPPRTTPDRPTRRRPAGRSRPWPPSGQTKWHFGPPHDLHCVQRVLCKPRRRARPRSDPGPIQVRPRPAGRQQLGQYIQKQT